MSAAAGFMEDSQGGPGLRTRLLRRLSAFLPRLAALAAVLALARLAAEFTWTLLINPYAGWSPQSVPGAAPAAQAFDLNAIIAADLFGHRQPAADLSKVSERPAAALKLSLSGIMSFGENDPRSLVLIVDKTAKPYGIGDMIDPGVMVKAIFKDRVVFEEDGRLTMVRLNPGGQGPASGSDAGEDEAEEQIKTGLRPGDPKPPPPPPRATDVVGDEG